MSRPSRQAETRTELERSLVMSAKQLNDLWHLDFEWAHRIMGLPQRTCSAMPSPEWGQPMASSAFERVKEKVKIMWCFAGQYFSVFNAGPNIGWGLRVNPEILKDQISLTDASRSVLGWIAKCPSPDECPTGHRYLRSEVQSMYYLGGPVSLTNWAPTKQCSAKVTCARDNSARYKGMYFVSTIRPLERGTEITWNYGHVKEMSPPSFEEITTWFLADCCKEGSDVSPAESTAAIRNTPQQPLKRKREVQAYRFCLYCGNNVEDSVKPESHTNILCHIATKHSLALCAEAELEGEVSHIDFLLHLQKVNKVTAGLKAHGYYVVPASHFLKNCSKEVALEDKDCARKEYLFKKFQQECIEAYKKYKAIYVKGITIPKGYDDLLPADVSNYSDILWEGKKRPRSNDFNVSNKIATHEKEAHEDSIRCCMKSIVTSYENYNSV